MIAADNNSKRQLGDNIKTALSFCDLSQNQLRYRTKKQKIEIFDICNGTFSGKETAANSKVVKDEVHSALFVKDKYLISDQAFHEISLFFNS